MTPTVASPRYFIHPPPATVTQTNLHKTTRQGVTYNAPKMNEKNRGDTPNSSFNPHWQENDINTPPTTAPPPSYGAHYGYSNHNHQAYNFQQGQNNPQLAQYYPYPTQSGHPPPMMFSQQGFTQPGAYNMTHMCAPMQQPNFGFTRASMNGQTQSFASTAYNEQGSSKGLLVPTASNGNTSTEQPDHPKNKHKDPKIMLPAPRPSARYLLQVSGRPEVVDPPDMKLVILDLNGTLLHRPNPRKQPKRMIGRPFLAQFLSYLFENFAVMIWSSAKPENVQILVERGLEEYRSQLIASWARDTLGLAPHHYSKNVQCYKDLRRVWAADEIQCNMLGYEEGKRFDQRNTILIDDSALKASAQPHNLLEIPEFDGTSANEITQDVLGEVAGYLELLKMQKDVSMFIHKTPFKADGTWTFDWRHLMPEDIDNKADDGTLKPVIL